MGESDGETEREGSVLRWMVTGADGRGECVNVFKRVCGLALHGFCGVDVCANTVLDMQRGAGWGTK